MKDDEQEVSRLYFRVLETWNLRDAKQYAALFTENARLVGFDGSMMNGREEVETAIREVFDNHQTAAYVGKVRGVDFPAPEVAVLQAVCGMVPPGQKDLNPAVNAIQSLVAVKRGGEWLVLLFQNTPAQFHGRPELSEALTNELRALL